MFDSTKSDKFLSRLQRLVSHLDGQPDLVVHQRVDQFYYMQQMEKLKLLMEQSEVACRRAETFQQHAQATYVQAFNQWKKDVRWLNRYYQKKLRPIS